MLKINDRIEIDERDIEERFIRASGPGGQNVNKVSTAVELRFDVHGSSALPPPVRSRLEKLAGRRLSAEGILVIRAERFRVREQNRQDARKRLSALIRQAATPRKARLATKPTYASKLRRLDAKKRRSSAKQQRQVRSERE